MNEIHVICSNLIEKDGNILLVKETKEEAKGEYNFPAGKLKVDENLIEAAIREAKEETGLDVKPVKLVGVFNHVPSRRNNNLIVFVFKSEIVSGEIKVSEAHPEIRFFSIEEIEELDKKNLLRSPYKLASIERLKKGELLDLSVIKML